MSIYKTDVVTTRRVRALLGAMLATQEYRVLRHGEQANPVYRKAGEILSCYPEGADDAPADAREETWRIFAKHYREGFREEGPAVATVPGEAIVEGEFYRSTDTEADHEWLISMRRGPKSFGRFLKWVEGIMSTTGGATLPDGRHVYLRSNITGGQRAYVVRLAGEVTAQIEAAEKAAAGIDPKIPPEWLRPLVLESVREVVTGADFVLVLKQTVSDAARAAFAEALAAAASQT